MASDPDVIGTVVGFARTLRHAGLPATPERTQATVSALSHLDVLRPADMYWAGRLTLCADPEDLPRYDAGFAAYFGGTPVHHAPQATDSVRYEPRPFEMSDTGVATYGDEPSHTVEASTAERLRHRDIAELSPVERAELRRLFALLAPRVGIRPTRRFEADHSGRVDARRTLRGVLRASGESGRLAFRRRRTKPRRLVFLVDVSRSMAPYADAMLRVAHAATRVNPAGTEVFTLGTRLTRVTREMRRRDPDLALRGASAAIPDWSGGTRLGPALKAFLDRWGQRGTARGAVVVLCSDGWERGDPDLLGAQVARLARLAHAVVWVNPHKGKPGFAPLAGGMQAALPHLAALVAGHSFASFEELAAALRRV